MNVDEFQRHNPTYFGMVMGIAFYEHPIEGDEAPLSCIHPDGRFEEFSEFWEVPDASDLADFNIEA